MRFLENIFQKSKAAFEEFIDDTIWDGRSENHDEKIVNIGIELTSENHRRGVDLQQELHDNPVEVAEDEDQDIFKDAIEYSDNDEHQEHQQQPGPGRQGRGRPRIVRTGQRGRPSKVYANEAGLAEFAYIADVHIKNALMGEDSSAWKEAMASEVRSLINENTWTLVDREEDHRVIDSRFVLRNKYGSDGEIEKRKARLVARGFSQRPGVDFHDTFAPVERLSSIRAAAAMAAEYEIKIHQIDIRTAYLNGNVEEKILMEVPEHFVFILEYMVKNERDINMKKKVE